MAEFKAATQSSEQIEANGSMSMIPRIVGSPVKVALKPPSAWTSQDCAKLRVPRESFGPLTEVSIRFEIEDGSAVAGCPATLAGAGTASFSIPLAESDATRVSMWVPPGSYLLKPELWEWRAWKTAFAFDPLTVFVGESPVDVVVRLSHPICFVNLDVRDEFGRSLKSFVIQTRRALMPFTRGAPVLAIDEDEWELAIAGVADAGYEGIPKHTKKLERGRLNTLRYDLKRKE
jgi:hypothetical protein